MGTEQRERQAPPEKAQARPVEAKAGPAEAQARPVEAKAGPAEAQVQPVEAQAGSAEAQARPVEAQTQPEEPQTRPAQTPAHSAKRQPALETVAGLLAVISALASGWQDGGWLGGILPATLFVPGCLLVAVIQLVRRVPHRRFFACLLLSSALCFLPIVLFWVVLLAAFHQM